MKHLLLVILITLTSMVSFADNKDYKERHWVIGLGPVYTPQLQGAAGGTKYGILLGYVQGLSERLDMLYFYNGNFNTATQGSTGVTEIALGFNVYTKDRGADFSPYITADLGYGGQNSTTDAGIMPGIGIGVSGFRTQNAAINFFYRRVYTVITSSRVSSFPYIDQFMLAVNF